MIELEIHRLKMRLKQDEQRLMSLLSLRHLPPAAPHEGLEHHLETVRAHQQAVDMCQAILGDPLLTFDVRGQASVRRFVAWLVAGLTDDYPARPAAELN